MTQEIILNIESIICDTMLIEWMADYVVILFRFMLL